MKLNIEVPRTEVLRYLGYPKGKKLRPRVERLMENLWPVASGLIEPQGCFKVVTQQQLMITGMPDPSPLVGVAVCTIGSMLTDEASNRSADGELLAALFFDAFGSAAVEASADILSRMLCDEASRRGFFADRRISPGYGQWPTASQPALLALLDVEGIGVSLTSRQMMMPRKSVSFAIRFQNEPGKNGHGGCAYCTLEDCDFRKEARL